MSSDDSIIKAMGINPVNLYPEQPTDMGPMLSDAKLTGKDHGPEPSHDSRNGNDWLNWWGKMNDTPNMNPWEVRDFYEDLIAHGKLRVVQEVVLADGICPACAYDAGMPRDVNGKDMTPPYCPGCGNKIKRP